MSIVLVGAGVMGESILAGLLDSGASPDDLLVVEREPERATVVTERYGVARTDAQSAARAASVVLLAVKPQDALPTLEMLAPWLASDALVVSVAAGVTCRQLEDALPAGTPVVRAMPNTPALVRAGVTAISPGRQATDEHLATAQRLLGAVGSVVRVPESQLDAVTALSGSGPAYVFLVVEALVEAGVRAGLPRGLAHDLVVGTLAGSAAMLTATADHPALLRERVTSPGGTTAAALHELERHGLRAAFSDAVAANRERARQLSADARGRGADGPG